MAQSFHKLRERLLRAGVAPRHVRRYLTELADHLADLRGRKKNARAAAGRMQNPRRFSGSAGWMISPRAMIEQRRFQSWCIRAPWAMFRSRPNLASGCGLVRCLVSSVVWLANLSCREPTHPSCASQATAYSSLANVYFQLDRAFLFRRADSRRLGNRTDRCSSKVQCGLAHRRLGPDRTDGRHGPGSSESHSRARRTGTYPHELRPWALHPGYFRWPLSCLGDSLAHGVAVSHLAITKS